MEKKKGQSSNISSVSVTQIKLTIVTVIERLTHFIRSLISSIKIALYFMKFGFKPVKPTLRLTPEALSTPLPDGLLSEIRQFLTRSEKWKNHPVASFEHFVIAPAPGVIQPRVIGPHTKPVFTSLGFGDMTIRDEMGACGSHTCGVLNRDLNFKSQFDEFFNGFIHNWTPCDGEKNYGDCNGTYSSPCDDQQCNDDGYFTCSPEQYSTCSEVNENLGFSEFWDHPFVVELRDYFQVDSVENLSTAVQEFIGRNMYDDSAIDTTCPSYE